MAAGAGESPVSPDAKAVIRGEKPVLVSEKSAYRRETAAAGTWLPLSAPKPVYAAAQPALSGAKPGLPGRNCRLRNR